ncbi:MAG: tyrosine-type recombinase/integrase, partial [Myxococcales bacterium]|nr:tyrosine-type recombinase/integrase [Myxococcales bacterium]
LDTDAVAALLDFDDGDPLAVRDRAILELTYSSGLRLAELVGLDLADVDLDEGMVLADAPIELQLVADLEAERLQLFVGEGEHWRRWAGAKLLPRPREAASESPHEPTTASLRALRERGEAIRGESIHALTAAVISEAPALRTLWLGEEQRLADLDPAADAVGVLDAAVQLALADPQRGLCGRLCGLAGAAAIDSTDIAATLTEARWLWHRPATGDLAILDGNDRILARLRACEIEVLIAEGPATTAEPAAATIPADPQQLLAIVLVATREILGLDPKLAIPPEQDLRELGMDSLLSFELADRISELLGIRLDDAFAADYPSVGAMVEALVGLATESRP